MLSKNESKRVGKYKIKSLYHRVKLFYYRKQAAKYKDSPKIENITAKLQKTVEEEFEDINQLKKEIGTGIALNGNSKITSDYKYLGGGSNLGLMDHTEINGEREFKYLTKILTRTIGENELFFYTKVYRNYKPIREITPKLVNLLEYKESNLCLITMEKIIGDEPSFDVDEVQKVIKASEVISSIKLEQLIKDGLMQKSVNANPKININWRHKYKFMGNAFSLLSLSHQEEVHKKIFIAIFKRMQMENYSKTCINLMKRVEKCIVDNQMSKTIKPNNHYSLRHSDLNKENMLIEKKSGSLYLIDWGQLSVGPSWLDIAWFLGKLRKPFDVVDDLYLANSPHLDDIGRVFFLYSLIIIWFLELSKEEFNDNYTSYLLPAVENIEQLQINMKRSSIISV
ncbi:phosphotransferase family protein [Virgibacillus litoralis]|uniref:Aminoglycoside phosphotransferase domain-containing protein n=1 Tax=Virgibacillus litoralis TaxID=578221 RepID=A0ABS4HE75_9BACI|nr:phosphotransferase [Virgibacillus litoralis]MBP1949039.1 hypothetical protein [Virgibacillus litoralis]